MITVTCLGAASTVTGSNYLVESSAGAKVIVDCGLFQGGKQIEVRNRLKWGFEPSEIRHVLLTHAHIDHCGRIPKLVKDGFTGKILTSPPTAELCEVMLLDSAHVQEMEAEWKSRKNKRKARQTIEPLYTTEDAHTSLQYFVPTERDEIFEVEPGIRGRFRNAGHILGSSVLELWVEDEGRETKIVFSGDLGRQDQLIVKDPFPIEEAHYVFLESTYGNRLHRNFDESAAELLEAIEYAVSHNEKIIIPAFALERTQEILYILGEFCRAGTLPDIPIYLDSPLAIKATEIFRRNREYFDQDAQSIVKQGLDPFDMPNLTFTPSTEESMEINRVQGSAIIISANGMCTAGRIKHHLKHNIWREGSSIVFMGFQANGTTGRKIVEGADRITLFGEKVAVRAKVWTIGGFSAHADQADLLKWVGRCADHSKPRVFLTHGEPSACEALAREIRKQYGLDCLIPQWREVLKLDPAEGVFEEIPAAEPPEVKPEEKTYAETLVLNLEKKIVGLKHKVAADHPDFSEEDLERLRDMSDDIDIMLES
jgi:metallo-beta-lactamase family protein